MFVLADLEKSMVLLYSAVQYSDFLLAIKCYVQLARVFVEDELFLFNERYFDEEKNIFCEDIIPLHLHSKMQQGQSWNGQHCYWWLAALKHDATIPNGNLNFFKLKLTNSLFSIFQLYFCSNTGLQNCGAQNWHLVSLSAYQSPAPAADSAVLPQISGYPVIFNIKEISCRCKSSRSAISCCCLS